jgi:hypothetical protein
MAHTIKLSLPPHAIDVGKDDIYFEVREDDELLGKLLVSKGAAVWFPKNGRVGYKMRWRRFAEMMMQSELRDERW